MNQNAKGGHPEVPRSGAALEKHADPSPAREDPPARRYGDGDGDAVVPLVVVTGGSKGIGKSCVESFARRGARVLFTYCSDSEAARRVERSFHPAGRVQGLQLDQGDFDCVQAFATEVDRWREGREVDTVVNNAALGVATASAYVDRGTRAIDGSTPAATAVSGSGVDNNDNKGRHDAARRRADEDVALMRVNALGPMWVTDALLPMMHERVAGSGNETRTEAAGTGAEGKQPAESRVHKTGGEILDEGAATSTSRAHRKKTVLFVGSVGGGSQSVFPGFRAADAMSKAAVAYASKHFAARSRRQMHEQAIRESAATATAGASNSSSTPAADKSAETTAEATIAAAVAAATPGEFDASGGVDFVCLCPGATLTDMFRASTLDKMTDPGELERFLRALPQGRLMRPEEVGEAVYWLCSSPAATMFHGAVIDASAGLAVRPGSLTEYSF